MGNTSFALKYNKYHKVFFNVQNLQMILCLFKSVGLAKMISLFDSLKSVKMTNGAAAQIAQMAQIVHNNAHCTTSG